MKIKISIFLFILFFLFGCGKREPIPYQLTEQDSLNFLVSNSDLIAVVEILDGSPHDPNSKRTLHKKVRARIQEPILWQGAELQEINIQYEPYFKRDSSIMGFVFFYNGIYLAFLKSVGNRNFRPTTGNSLSSVIGLNRVYPIWKQGIKNETKGPLSDGFKLSEIKAEIKRESKKKSN